MKSMPIVYKSGLFLLLFLNWLQAIFKSYKESKNKVVKTTITWHSIWQWLNISYALTFYMMKGIFHSLKKWSATNLTALDNIMHDIYFFLQSISKVQKDINYWLKKSKIKQPRDFQGPRVEQDLSTISKVKGYY